MAQIRSRDEALAAVERALGGWLQNAAGVMTQAAATADAAQSVAAAEVRRWANTEAALRQLLAAAKDEETARPLRQKLNRALACHQTALQASAQVAEVARRVAVLRRQHSQQADAMVGEARADLLRRMGDLDSYRAAGAGGGLAGSGSAGGVPASVLAPGAGGAAWLGGLGMSEIDIETVNFTDNPIQGKFGKGGASRADYRWAVQTWCEYVGLGAARGMTRDDFVARDEAQGAGPLRRSTDVYDMFLGDDRIRVSKRADGSFDVVGGRHRLEIARDLGIGSLPAQVYQ
jgi:hypothetical protein